MKKSVLLFAAILLIGCTPEETPKDCNCNKVTNVTSFNSPYGSFGFYVTKNECSGEESGKIQWTKNAPSVGECR